MKSFILILIPVLVGSVMACKKDVAEPAKLSMDEVNQKSKITYGQVVFWTKSTSQAGVLYVDINGEQRQSVNYTDTPPTCGDNGFATYKLATGDYTYAVSTSSYNNSSNNPRSVNGFVTVTQDGCEAIEIK
jgi:hypothetical protein